MSGAVRPALTAGDLASIRTTAATLVACGHELRGARAPGELVVRDDHDGSAGQDGCGGPAGHDCTCAPGSPDEPTRHGRRGPSDGPIAASSPGAVCLADAVEELADALRVFADEIAAVRAALRVLDTLDAPPEAGTDHPDPSDRRRLLAARAGRARARLRETCLGVSATAAAIESRGDD